jgi:hypothetical protein
MLLRGLCEAVKRLKKKKAAKAAKAAASKAKAKAKPKDQPKPKAKAKAKAEAKAKAKGKPRNEARCVHVRFLIRASLASCACIRTGRRRRRRTATKSSSLPPETAPRRWRRLPRIGGTWSLISEGHGSPDAQSTTRMSSEPALVCLCQHVVAALQINCRICVTNWLGCWVD